MSAEHWSDDGLPVWNVAVGDRVRHGVDLYALAAHEPAIPIGTLGTVVWVEDREGPREVWVRWDGVPYSRAEGSSMATWIEPVDAADSNGAVRGRRQ